MGAKPSGDFTMTFFSARKIYAATLCAGCALSLAAFAGDGGHDKMSKMDADGNGQISASEHEAGAKKMFEKMDADHDGQVTATEMDAGREARAAAQDTRDQTTGGEATRLGKKEGHGMSSAQKIKKFDTNGDDAISAAEHATGAKEMFGKMDKDGNGSLTTAEMRAGHDKMMSAQDTE
jgi:EF hand